MKRPHRPTLCLRRFGGLFVVLTESVEWDVGEKESTNHQTPHRVTSKTPFNYFAFLMENLKSLKKRLTWKVSMSKKQDFILNCFNTQTLKHTLFLWKKNTQVLVSTLKYLNSTHAFHPRFWPTCSCRGHGTPHTGHYRLTGYWHPRTADDLWP